MPRLLVLTALAFAGYAALLPVAPLLAVRGGADAFGAGLVNGVLLACTVVTQLAVPALLRRFGWTAVLVAGMLLLGLPTAGFFLSDALAPILLVSALRGLGFGILTVTGSALVAELVEPARRGQAVGLYGLAIALPQVLFVPAGPWVVEEFGFAPMIVVGLLPVLAAWPAYRLSRMAERVPEPRRRAPYARMLPPMALLLAATLAGGALITFAAQMHDGGAGLTVAALLCLTLAAAFTRWWAGIAADRRGPRPFVAPLVLITAIGMALVGWSVREPAAVVAPLLLAGATLVGIGYGALQNLTLLLTFATVDRQHYGAASTMWNVGFDVGTALGSVVIGAIAAGASFSTAMLVGGAVSLLTVPLALRRGRD
ncbi:MAG: MFS transporter [Microbacteriaceae bacterium]|nr:MFS transporter [Microbacteriaceae bacterium]